MNTTQSALEFSSLKHNAIPFPQVQEKDFLPKLKECIDRAQVEISGICDNPEPPNFSNTLLALETTGEDVSLVASVFYNLLHAHTTEGLQKLAQEFGPLLSAYSNDITLNDKLFQRVKFVFDHQNHENLNTEETKLLEDTYQDFVRNGALLSHADKQKLRQIDAELSTLSPKFQENVLKATNAFELWIEDSSDLDGLPESAISTYAQAAKEKGRDGQWLITLQAPSYIPFMQYSSQRPLREKLWKAYSSRAYQDKFDNQATLKKTLSLREARAQLLGFPTHAHFVLKKRMAETPENVFSFLEELKIPSVKKARAEVNEVKDLAKQLDQLDDFQAWDFSYYSEKLKQKQFQFNSEDLRPYFKLENVVSGVFAHAEKLYDLQFRLDSSVPVYHPDVECYEVTDKTTGKFIGLFYTDFFPRDSKSGGAWQNTFLNQGYFKGEVRRPHACIVCNFTKPTSDKPSLLTLDEVLTLFHEFGHALHTLLSQCYFVSLGGTHVYWDFVELPSQIMENWALEKEGLALFATHFETGDPMPQDLMEKMRASQKFLTGYQSLRQVTFATIDMLYHTTPADKVTSVTDFEDSATKDLRVFPHVDGTNFSCAFSHIFSGGYAAGYYSYKWAEVLDADAFEYFLEEGLFNSKVANKFKTEVLSRGGTDHPMVLYKNFRGREPKISALLKRDGLI